VSCRSAMSKELSPQWVLLGLLTHKPRHGYELHQCFTAPSPLERIWYLGMSQTYKLLKELEEMGYVEATIQAQETRPDRRVYHVTSAGREAFFQWLQTPVTSFRLIRVEFLGKLYLAQALGPEWVKRAIEVQTEACQALLADLKGSRPGEGFEDLVFRFRSGQIEAVIDWLEYCRRTLLPAAHQDEQ
jgi:PadR family transcriptional regulator AphA